MADLDPGIAIQKAIFAALGASADVQAVFAAAKVSGAPRIYSRVPPGAPLPYYVIGMDEVCDDSAEEIDSSETHASIHCWSNSPSLGEIKSMTNAARVALKVIPDLSADGHVCTTAQYLKVEPVGSLDGETDHRVVTFKYLTDPIVD